MYPSEHASENEDQNASFMTGGFMGDCNYYGEYGCKIYEPSEEKDCEEEISLKVVKVLMM